MGIVRRDHDVVVADSFDDIRDQLLLHVYGNETLAQEIIARLPAQRLVRVAFAQFPAFVQSVKHPRQPAAVAFEKSHAQFRKPLQDPARAKTSHGEHELDGIAKGINQYRFVGVPLETVDNLILIRTRRRMKTDRHA